jgi:outer membrane protein OmpA-like peptidoglycan-associated protein
LLLALGSCSSSPPKPPTVDPASRRPANTTAAVEVQVCRSDLQNARILASENARAAQASSETASRLAQQIRTQPTQSSGSAAPRNKVYSILFGFGSANLPLSSIELSAAIDEARVAPLVVLSGRTDGTTETPGEARIARQRAAAVQAFLVAAGVEPARIRTTWQAVGDYAADNTSPAGRALNRRVEIEIYQAAPQVAAVAATPQS